MPASFPLCERKLFSITFLSSLSFLSLSLSLSLSSFARQPSGQKTRNGRPRPRRLDHARAVLSRERRRRALARRDEARDGKLVVDRWRWRRRRHLRRGLRLAPVEPLRSVLPAAGGDPDKGTRYWSRLIVDQSTPLFSSLPESEEKRKEATRNLGRKKKNSTSTSTSTKNNNQNSKTARLVPPRIRPGPRRRRRRRHRQHLGRRRRAQGRHRRGSEERTKHNDGGTPTLLASRGDV